MDDYAAFDDFELDYRTDRDEMTEQVEADFDREIDHLIKEGYSTLQQKTFDMTEHTPTTVMTKADKKELDEALNKISDAKSVIENLACHYRDKFDDLTEKAQEGERGTAIDEAASELETMDESLQEIISNGETLVS